jgi:hypothetical protein
MASHRAKEHAPRHSAPETPRAGGTSRPTSAPKAARGFSAFGVGVVTVGVMLVYMGVAGIMPRDMLNKLLKTPINLQTEENTQHSDSENSGTPATTATTSASNATTIVGLSTGSAGGWYPQRSATTVGTGARDVYGSVASL